MIDWTEDEVRKSSIAKTLKGVIQRSPFSNEELPPTISWLMGEGWPGKDAPLEVYRAALEELDQLGEIHLCRGGFWRDLEFASKVLGFADLATHFRGRMREALLRLAAKEGAT